MPIINATNSIWLTGEIRLPISGSTLAVFNNFSSKQISDRSAATDIAYGAPYAKIWDVGHTYWQTDFSCPLLVAQANYTPRSPYYEATQCIQELMQEILSVNGFKQGDSFTTNTLKDKWDFGLTETITSNNADYIIQKLSIDITETESSFSVSILSTMDIRPYFNVFSKDNLNSYSPFLEDTVYRTVAPFDIDIPTDCIGAPFGFLQPTAKQWPIQTINSTAYSSLLKEFHLTIESDEINKTPSIGIPSSRTFLGVNSVKCSGNIKYIPLFYPGDGTIRFQSAIADFAPAGWVVDTQSIDNIANTTRHGGRLSISMDMVNPMFVQAIIRNRNNYIINGKDLLTPIGPVSTSSWGLSTAAKQTNEISVDFVTSPGL